MNFEMRGLRDDNPQGWLAAIGVLYLLDRMAHKAQLSWPGKHPVIHGSCEEKVIAALSAYLKNGSDLLQRLPPSQDGVKIALDLTAGRVSFTGVILEMVKAVTPDKIKEALTKTWINRDDITSLGWDTNAVKLSAISGGNSAPDSSPHRGVLAGQWLAAESLPVTSTGPRSNTYSWVTWSVPLDIGGVRSVVMASSSEWGGSRYVASVGRNGQMGYFEPPRTLINQ